MKLDDLKYKAKEMINRIKEKTRGVTVDYQGTEGDYESNKNRATIGVVGGLVALPFIPPVGLAALGYGGVKAYQAYKDKNHDKGGENGNDTSYGRSRRSSTRRTIG